MENRRIHRRIHRMIHRRIHRRIQASQKQSWLTASGHGRPLHQRVANVHEIERIHTHSCLFSCLCVCLFVACLFASCFVCLLVCVFVRSCSFFCFLRACLRLSRVAYLPPTPLYCLSLCGLRFCLLFVWLLQERWRVQDQKVLLSLQKGDPGNPVTEPGQSRALAGEECRACWMRCMLCLPTS